MLGVDQVWGGRDRFQSLTKVHAFGTESHLPCTLLGTSKESELMKRLHPSLLDWPSLQSQDTVCVSEVRAQIFYVPTATTTVSRTYQVTPTNNMITGS